jgi:hypothetical protein
LRLVNVYALVDPATEIPFYIGIGSDSRPQAHFAEADSSARSLKISKIRKLRTRGAADYQMLRWIARGVDLDVAQCTERWLIATWGRMALREGPLTNIHPGGEFPSFFDDHLMRERHHRATETANRKKYEDPQFRERQASSLRALHRDPDFRSNNAERNRRQVAEGTWRANHGAAMHALRGDERVRNGHKLVDRAKSIEAIKRFWSTDKANVLRQDKAEIMRAREADPVWREKRLAGIAAYWQKRREERLCEPA